MTRRRVIALAAILALLFGQVSLAAYACADAVRMHAPAIAEDCPGHAPTSTDTVSAMHCHAGATLPSTHTPDFAPVASPVLVLRLPATVEPRTSFIPSSQRIAMATAPPAAIRFCRLLI